ncbi:MAG: hypothetical protein P4L16_00035 [Chlamydiales bacterium]|nr:hypothetical protein [Chlamydiales bacterium]
MVTLDSSFTEEPDNIELYENKIITIDAVEVILYRKAIRVISKLDMERTVKSLNDEEYEKLLKAMETHEGWIEGYTEKIN